MVQKLKMCLPHRIGDPVGIEEFSNEDTLKKGLYGIEQLILEFGIGVVIG